MTMAESGYPPNCPPPLAHASTPATVLPHGACDAHFHVFGPYASYPLSPGRTYTPPEAPLSAYLRMAATVGLDRFVIVQPSVYDADNACMLAALEVIGRARARAVAVIDDRVSAAALRAMNQQGVRGIRFNAVTGDRDFQGKLEQAARRIAELGWHVQLFVDPADLRACLPLIQRLPVDIIIDHLGQIDPSAGMDGMAFDTLRRILDTGRAWVKLTGYRCSRAGAPYADLAPYVRVLAHDHGDRLLWGSNWPHPIRYHDMPDDGLLVDALAGWLDDPVALRRTLVDNPGRLYGFESLSRSEER
jgi:predicted TIM-barrel fold metal-dependent hydrolase